MASEFLQSRNSPTLAAGGGGRCVEGGGTGELRCSPLRFQAYGTAAGKLGARQSAGRILCRAPFALPAGGEAAGQIRRLAPPEV
jgi:hypothetical protein